MVARCVSEGMLEVVVPIKQWSRWKPTSTISLLRSELDDQASPRLRSGLLYAHSKLRLPAGSILFLDQRLSITVVRFELLRIPTEFRLSSIGNIA